jgi:hypothetical protein
VPVQKADSAAGAPSVRCPPTIGHAESLGRPLQAVEHAVGVLAVGADERVDERQRAAAHGPHVGDVGGDGGGAGRERVGGQQRGRDRLAAEHEPAVAVVDDGAVVAVGGEAAAVEQRSSRFARRPGRRGTAAAR